MSKGKYNSKGQVNATDEDILAYQKAWAEEMAYIWRERIKWLRVIDTASLYGSVGPGIVESSNGSATITHRFLEYGLYQDRGTGNGYSYDNGGDLEILDPMYRAEHGMDNMRKPRPWYNLKYFISNLVLRDKMAELYGQQFCGMMVELLTKDKSGKISSARGLKAFG